MGKKGKRNRAVSTKQKGTSNVDGGGVSETCAASDIAVVGGIEETPRGTTSISTTSNSRNITQSLSNLMDINDYQGILRLESNAIRQAKVLEIIAPQKTSYIYQVIAIAIYETGSLNKEARKKAIRYMERSFTVAEKMDNNVQNLQSGAQRLVQFYLEEGRHVEAFVTVKRLASCIPQHELIDPDFILSLAIQFSQATKFDIVIDVLTMFLGTIIRSWDKEKRAAAYLAFGEGYTFFREYEKAASFLHKALAITDDTERKVAVLCQMGVMSKCMCNYDDALAALNQALEFLSAESGERTNKSPERWSKRSTAFVHRNIGDVLSEQGKHDLEALESYERALVITKEPYSGDAERLEGTYHGIGVVHARLGNWDKAINYLILAHNSIGTETYTMNSNFHAIICEEIAKVRLDQYFWDERLRHDTQERENIVREAAIFSHKSMTFGFNPKDANLIGAQVAYLIAGIEEANKFLMAHFEAEMEKNVGVSCRSCTRKAGNGTDIKICRNCQVVDYCSEAHQALAWRRGRLSHKVMCPFLKRYRLVVKAENRIDTESVEDICKDFFETVCVLKDVVK